MMSIPKVNVAEIGQDGQYKMILWDELSATYKIMELKETSSLK